MKKLVTLSVLLFTIFSCSVDTDNMPELDPYGTWELVRTHGQVPDSERTGSEMQFQENYLIREDGTFIKKREEDGITTQITGTYLLDEEGFTSQWGSPMWFITMKYEERSILIASCTSSQLEEDLFFTRDLRLVSTHHQCDGLGLEYRKLKN